MDVAQMETLDDIRERIIAMWLAAVRDRHGALHTPVVTSAQDSVPAPRIMVLRDVAADGARFRFHTDVRSAKAASIGAGAPVSILGYDPESRVQLIARGIGIIESDGPVADLAWAASAPSSRRCYLAAHAPGTPVEVATAGLPDHLLNRAPTQAESQAGRANFAVLLVEVQELEWLLLTSCGNRRAVFTRKGEDWHGQWITP